MKLLLVTIVFSVLANVNSLKILGVLPFASSSHFAIGNGIVQSLHKAGHDITVISPYPQKKPKENFRDIDVSHQVEKFKKDANIDVFSLNKMNPILMMTFLYKLGNDLVEEYMNYEEVKQFLAAGEKFDVCIVEYFNADAFLGIAEHVGCVHISYTTFEAVKWINDMTGNQMSSAYVPQPFLSFTDTMNFSQRLKNTLMTLVENLSYPIHLWNQNRLYNKYFPNAKRSLSEMFKSSAIIFMNSHVSSSSPRPFLPNMIEIGGIHVAPAKTLPADIKNFLDSAEHGAILFSMGSIVKSVEWPEERREAFVRAFKKLKLKVLWKYENETLPNKPENVMISPWIPQRDILAHPNVKLFITHGGLLGTTEALVEGVPVLGIPIFGDQKMNMARAVQSGYGLQINLDDVNAENIEKALSEIISDEKYSKIAKKISSQFTDRPMTSQESVVYWTEFAYRHKGAPHLAAAGNKLNFIEFHLIDVYATIAIIGLIGFYVMWKVMKFICGKICCGKPKSDEKVKRQ